MINIFGLIGRKTSFSRHVEKSLCMIQWFSSNFNKTKCVLIRYTVGQLTEEKTQGELRN